MLAISVRQPWAWLITQGEAIAPAMTLANVKEQWDGYEGWVLIHASTTRDKLGWSRAVEICTRLDIELPYPSEVAKGGIVGAARLVGCAGKRDAASGSHFFLGPWALLLEDAVPVAFLPCKGKPWPFDVPLEQKLTRVAPQAPLRPPLKREKGGLIQPQLFHMDWPYRKAPGIVAQDGWLKN